MQEEAYLLRRCCVFFIPMKTAPVIFLFVIYVIIHCPASLAAQNKHINNRILQHCLEPVTVPELKRNPAFLNIKNKKGKYSLNPMVYLSSGLIYFYQRFVSEHFQSNCTYEITCSEYTKKCISRYGLIKGTLLGVHQLNNCFVTAKDDYCRISISNNFKIINSLEDCH